jgi:hypothetical protein
MLNITQELSNKIAEGNHWLIHNDEQVIDAFASRNAARAAKGENKIKQWDEGVGFNLIGNGHSAEPGEIDVVETLQAVGLNPVIIDENTDFSKLPHLNQFVKDLGGEVRETEDATEFAMDKEAEVKTEELKTKPIDPKKEAKPKVDILHKSTAEKPTRMVHDICDVMYGENPDVTRKEIIAACTEAGIAHYTILTQYQAWRANRGE